MSLRETPENDIYNCLHALNPFNGLNLINVSPSFNIFPRNRLHLQPDWKIDWTRPASAWNLVPIAIGFPV